MVDSTKVLCPLFDEIEILIPGDSPQLYASETWTLLAADVKTLEAFHMK